MSSTAIRGIVSRATPKPSLPITSKSNVAGAVVRVPTFADCLDSGANSVGPSKDKAEAPLAPPDAAKIPPADIPGIVMQPVLTVIQTNSIPSPTLVPLERSFGTERHITNDAVVIPKVITGSAISADQAGSGLEPALMRAASSPEITPAIVHTTADPDSTLQSSNASPVQVQVVLKTVSIPPIVSDILPVAIQRNSANSQPVAKSDPQHDRRDAAHLPAAHRDVATAKASSVETGIVSDSSNADNENARGGEPDLQKPRPAFPIGNVSATPSIDTHAFDGTLTLLEPNTQRIAETILAEAPSAMTEAQSVSTAGQGSSAGIVRTMAIELTPPDMGRLTVEMKIKDGALSIRLDAPTADAAAALHQDRDRLSLILTNAGYSIDSIAIQSPNGSITAAAPHASFMSTQPDASSSQQHHSQGQPHARENPQNSHDESHANPAAANHRVDPYSHGAVYL